MIALIFAAVACLGWAAALLLAWRLRSWEKQLKGARIAIAYNRRVQMQPTLLDLLNWALLLHKDKRNSGQVFYKQTKHTVAILKPLAGQHGKAKTITRPADYAPRHKDSPIQEVITPSKTQIEA